jgi:GMP synthase-like glutamine amidotransferase
VPVLGHCLGGQDVRARRAPVPAPDAGDRLQEVAVSSDAARDAWFGGREAFDAFQWHYDVFALPPGATRVLTNGFNANQAYVIDERHIGFQCHIEMTRELTETWLALGADELPAQSTPAVQSAVDIRLDLDERIAALKTLAGDVYTRWTQGLAR